MRVSKFLFLISVSTLLAVTAPLSKAIAQTAVPAVGSSPAAPEVPATSPTVPAPARDVEARYGYSSERHGNFRFGPIGLLVGYIGANLDFKLGDSSWTLGPEVSYWDVDIFDVDFEATWLGLRANYYIGRPALTTGWYIGPFVSYAKVITKDNDSSRGGEGRGEDKSFRLGALGGYTWIWSSFNMMLGGGLQASTGDDVRTYYPDGSYKTDDKSAAGLTAEFTIGWVF